MPPKLYFRHTLVRRRTPSETLGGRWVMPRPILDAAVGGPLGALTIQGIVDTGADETILPQDVAAQVGIDLTHSPVGSTRGLGGQSIQIKYATAVMLIDDGRAPLEWSAVFGFHPLVHKRCLFGFGGFLQYFDAEFIGDHEFFSLVPNTLFPGTITP